MKLKFKIIILLILCISCGSNGSKTKDSSTVEDIQSSIVQIIEKTREALNKQIEEFLGILKVEKNLDLLELRNLNIDNLASLNAPEWFKALILEIFKADDKLRNIIATLEKETKEIIEQSMLLRDEMIIVNKRLNDSY